MHRSSSRESILSIGLSFLIIPKVLTESMGITPTLWRWVSCLGLRSLSNLLLPHKGSQWRCLLSVQGLNSGLPITGVKGERGGDVLEELKAFQSVRMVLLKVGCLFSSGGKEEESQIVGLFHFYRHPAFGGFNTASVHYSG